MYIVSENTLNLNLMCSSGYQLSLRQGLYCSNRSKKVFHLPRPGGSNGQIGTNFYEIYTV